MRAYVHLWVVAQSVQQSHGVRRVQERCDFLCRHPPSFGHLWRRNEVTPDGTTSKYQRDDAKAHVLVDTSEAFDLDDKTCLFQEFPDEAFRHRFGQFENTARRLPLTVVLTTDCQGSVGGINDGRCDTDRMTLEVLLHPRYLRGYARLVYPSIGVPRVEPGIDPTSDRPVFRQIAEQLRAQILDGSLGEGAKLPSESELIGTYGTARMTVRQAIASLKSEGLVHTEHGKGAFVRRRPQVRRLSYDRFARRHRKAGKAAWLAEAELVGFTPGVEVVGVERIRATETVADRLGLRRGSSVVSRSRRYLADGEPVELATSYIPWEIAKGTPIAENDAGPGGIYARIEERGHRLSHFTEDVTTRMPTPDEMRSLRLASGVPVMVVARTAYDVDDRAVELCDTVMAGDRFVLAYRLPAD
ncbi:MAG: GntR family transcriptional regulator [Actinomycetota bacterium]|nr:GntR family transcriptional regulator [Actinomycetota bacterium]